MIQDAVKIVTNRRRSGSVKQLETWKTRVSLFLRGNIAQLQQQQWAKKQNWGYMDEYDALSYSYE